MFNKTIHRINTLAIETAKKLKDCDASLMYHYGIAPDVVPCLQYAHDNNLPFFYRTPLLRFGGELNPFQKPPAQNVFNLSRVAATISDVEIRKTNRIFLQSVYAVHLRAPDMAIHLFGVPDTWQKRFEQCETSLDLDEYVENALAFRFNRCKDLEYWDRLITSAEAPETLVDIGVKAAESYSTISVLL